MPTKTLTVATFNLENLFTRWKFRGRRLTYYKSGKKKYRWVPFTPKQAQAATELGFVLDKNKFERVKEPIRKITAKVIKAVKADVMGVQEVENLDTLRTFNTRHLRGKKKFRYPILIDSGNDPRRIDVGAFCNKEIDFIRTHQYLRSGRAATFSRDCLEIHVKIGTISVPVFVNHFKSMLGGRAATKKRRETQSEAVVKILTDRFGTNFGKEYFVIVGDLNDYMEPGKEKESGLRALLESDQMENVVDRLPKDQRWTHFYKGDKSYHQLDYILISRKLAQKNPNVKPVIERRGQPKRVNLGGKPPRVTKFFPEIAAGNNNLKASDHCPVAIKLKL